MMRVPSILAMVAVLAAACAAPEDVRTPIPTATVIPATPPPAATLEPTPAPTATPRPSERATLSLTLRTAPLPPGSQPHDVAPADDGGVWYTGQGNGTLGWFDPETDEVREVPLGAGSAPQTDAVWVTDFGANALLRFDATTEEWTSLPHDASPANVRQLLGRPGEVWGVESAADSILVVRHSGG